ncbi:MAG TPA: GAF domain-containing protein, partial [Desulfobaccales bacterium]
AGLLHLNACAGIPEEEARRIQWLDYGTAVCDCAARDGCRIVSENIQTTDDPRTELVKSYGIQAYACHPLIIGGRVLGTLSFGTRKKTNFPPDELALMKAVADQVAIAMDRKLAEEALQRANEELEQRVAERTEDLEETVAQLEEEISDRQLAEAALDTERKRLFAVLESMPAHVSLVRPDHTYAYVNGEFVRRFGEPGEMHCYERMGMPGPCTECQAMAVFQTGTPVIWEWTGPDDKVYQIFDYPFIDVDGSPLALEMGIDITEARQAEAEIRQQAALLDLAHDAIIVRDLDSHILFWNRGAEETYGFKKAKALNQGTHSLLQTQPPIPLRDIDQALMEQGHWYGELVHTRADGSAIVVASRQVLQKNEAGEPTAVLEINRDITARKEAEKKAESVGRLYRLLSRVNETIVRARDRESLYREVCRVAVEEGRFRLAWVGLVDQDTQAIKAVAQFGFEEGYLENLSIPLADVPEGRGPTGTAGREGRLDFCNDYAAEPRMAPWREAALARGYRSS